MKRFITGTIFAFVLIATILLRDVSLSFFDAFIGIAMILASLEMSNAIEKINLKNVKYVGMFYPVAMYLCYLLCIKNNKGIGFIVVSQLLIVLAILLLLFIAYLIYELIKNHKLNKKYKSKFSKLILNSLKVTLNTLITFIYPSLIMGLMFVINHITEFAGVQSSANLGLLLLCLLFVITFVTDIFAYFVGSAFGGPKLCPLISPKKTISGAIGGIFFSVLAMVVTFYAFNSVETFTTLFINKEIGLLFFIILGIIGSILSQLGDLLASLIKRKCGIKDFGTILPGHGGILDRFDGVLINTIFIIIIACIFLI